MVPSDLVATKQRLLTTSLPFLTTPFPLSSFSCMFFLRRTFHIASGGAACQRGKSDLSFFGVAGRTSRVFLPFCCRRRRCFLGFTSYLIRQLRPSLFLCLCLQTRHLSFPLNRLHACHSVRDAAMQPQSKDRPSLLPSLHRPLLPESQYACSPLPAPPFCAASRLSSAERFLVVFFGL